MHGPLDEHLHTEECNVIIRELQRCHQVPRKNSRIETWEDRFQYINFKICFRKTACSNSFLGHAINLTGQLSNQKLMLMTIRLKLWILLCFSDPETHTVKCDSPLTNVPPPTYLNEQGNASLHKEGETGEGEGGEAGSCRKSGKG